MASALSKKREVIWWLFLAAVLIVGVAATVNGYLLRGITSTNLSNTVPWGIWVVFYIYFIGISVGSFFVAVMAYGFRIKALEPVGRTALLTALVSLIVGLIFITLDIGRIDHLLNTILYWNVTSMMAWEIRFYIVYFIALALAAYFSMRGDFVHMALYGQGGGKRLGRLLSFGKKSWNDEDQESSLKTCKAFTIIGVPFVLLVSTGALFAVLESQPFMNHSLTPLAFLISELVCGTAAVLLLYLFQEKRAGRQADQTVTKRLGSLLILFICIELLMVWYELLVGFYNMKPDEWEVWSHVLTGNTWWLFWIFQMGLALVIPLFLLAVRKNKSAGRMALAGILIMIGVIGVRYNMVVPSFLAPRLSGMPSGIYSPTASEWLTCAGLASLWGILYTLGEKWLPVRSEQIGTLSRKDEVNQV